MRHTTYKYRAQRVLVLSVHCHSTQTYGRTYIKLPSEMNSASTEAIKAIIRTTMQDQQQVLLRSVAVNTAEIVSQAI